MTLTRTTARSRRTGTLGEDIAARYLGDLGWEVLERNWRPERGRGELDLIAREPAAPEDPGSGDRLVVVEVKTRRSLAAGPPAQAVDARKLAQLRRLAVRWAESHEVAHVALRIDVVSVLLREGAPAELRHHRGVLL